MRSVDLNCDMGEGFPHDRELMDLVSSVNVACGYHAGDQDTMQATVNAAAEKNVQVGAHPSFPDRENFGRLPMALSSREVYQCVFDQLTAFRTICRSVGVPMMHVKPHGALYNLAARDIEIALAIAHAVRDIDHSLVLYGLSGSQLISAGGQAGLLTVSEVFADRTYRPDGTLTSRMEPNALIADAWRAAAQALSMVAAGCVLSVNGDKIAVVAETICIHGDGANVLEFAAAIRRELVRNNINIRPLYD